MREVVRGIYQGIRHFQFENLPSQVQTLDVDSPEGQREKARCEAIIQDLQAFHKEFLQRANQHKNKLALARRDKRPFAGEILALEPQGVKIKIPYGEIFLEWEHISQGSIFQSAQNLVENEDDIFLWWTGVYGYESGIRAEALDAMVRYSQVTPEYRDKLTEYLDTVFR